MNVYFGYPVTVETFAPCDRVKRVPVAFLIQMYCRPSLHVELKKKLRKAKNKILLQKLEISKLREILHQ